MRGPEREQKSEAAANQRQHDTFGEQLANDARTMSAQSETQRDFLATGRAARQQHVGEVETSDEQNRSRHAQKQRAEHGKLVFDGIRTRTAVEARERCSRKGLVFLLDRKRLLEIRGQSLQRGASRRAGQARFQPAEDDQLVTGPVA